MSATPDTFFTFVRDDGTSVTIGVNLEPSSRPEAWVLEGLLVDYVLDGLLECVERADQPYGWAAEHVRHAFSHLRQDEWVDAWPPLVTGVEGLFWAGALRDGYINDAGRYTGKATRADGTPLTGRADAAPDLILALPINERVRRFLNREAFGGEANWFRHGRRHPQGERAQCLIWLLALAAWVDMFAWQPR